MKKLFAHSKLFLLIPFAAIIVSAIAGVVVLRGALPQLDNPRASLAAEEQLKAAWQRAREAGSYQFNGDVTQVTLPTARITNVGRGSKSTQMHVEGKTDVRQNTLEMKLWAQDGSVVGGQNDARREGGERQELYAPGRSWRMERELSDLHRRHRPQWRFHVVLACRAQCAGPCAGDQSGHSPLPATLSRSMARPSPRLCATRWKPPCAPKANWSPARTWTCPTHYSQMTGDGELWVRTGGPNDGMPLRQIIESELPRPERQQPARPDQDQLHRVCRAARQRLHARSAARARHLPSPDHLCLRYAGVSRLGFLFVFLRRRAVSSAASPFR